MKVPEKYYFRGLFLSYKRNIRMEQTPNKSTNIQYTAKQIDAIYLVWIENYNQFIQLAEPAYFVFNLHYGHGLNKKEIAPLCSNAYNISIEKSTHFINEIIDGIENLAENEEISGEVKVAEPDNNYAFSSFSEKEYTIGNKHYLFRYESRLYEHFLHPLLEHLETKTTKKADFVYELFFFNGRTFLRHNAILQDNWNEEDSQLIKGAVFIQLLNDIYDKQTSDWMTTLHASALSNNHKTMAFSAASGSGKSTIAALLRTRGFSLISDDFVALDRTTKQAHPFPITISIKDGAVDMLAKLYPSLNEKKSQALSYNRSGRYLSSEKEIGLSLQPLPIKELVFVEYNPDVEFEFTPMNRFKAMQLLIDESWIPASMDNIEHFLEWITSVSFFKLRYSNNQKALDTLSELFEV